MYKPMRTASDMFWTSLRTVVVLSFGLMLVIMIVQILSRYVFGIAVPWTDEASRYFYITEIFLGAAIAQRSREHIRITVLTDLVASRAAKDVLEAIKDAIMMIVVAMVGTGAFGMIHETRGVYASTFNLSFSVIYTVQFVSMCIMALLLGRDIVLRLRRKGNQLP